MANKTTVALSKKQYKEIIYTMRSGGAGFRPNDRIASCLVLEANLGIRIEDILSLRLEDIVKDGRIYRLNIVEQKTKKKRTFLVPVPIYKFIKDYCKKYHISKSSRIFDIGERAVQKQLRKVVDYLGYEHIGTHSFRKFYASTMYEENNHDIALVQQLLQHSSVTTTQRYITRSSDQLEEALQKHVYIV